MNVYEARNHVKREILVVATTQTVARFAAGLKHRARTDWRDSDRLELVVLGEGLDAAAARAFIRAYCPLRATAGWRVTKQVGEPRAARPSARLRAR